MIELNLRIAGYFKVDVIDMKTQQIKQHVEFPNIITNAGLDLIGLGTPLPNCFAYLDVGTGNTTPTATDHQLDHSVGTRTNFSSSFPPVTTTSTTPECAKRQITRIFTETQVNGTLAEMGFWTSGSGGVLVNRALFKDASGSITTVKKTAADWLRVIFEYQVFAPGDYTGSGNYNVSGSIVPVTYTIRPQGVNLGNNWVRLLDDMGKWRPVAYALPDAVLVPRTSFNTSAAAVASSSSSVSLYTTGSYYRDIECIWSASLNNVQHGIVSFTPWSTVNSVTGEVFQMLTDPTIVQSIDQKAKVAFRISWNRP